MMSPKLSKEHGKAKDQKAKEEKESKGRGTMIEIDAAEDR